RRNLCQVIFREVLAQVDGVAVLANTALQRLLELVLVLFRVSGVRPLSVESQLLDEVEKFRNTAVALCTQPDSRMLLLDNIRVAEVITLRLEQFPNAIHLLAHSGGRLPGLQGVVPLLHGALERGDRARLLLIEKPVRGRCKRVASLRRLYVARPYAPRTARSGVHPYESALPAGGVEVYTFRGRVDELSATCPRDRIKRERLR